MIAINIMEVIERARIRLQTDRRADKVKPIYDLHPANNNYVVYNNVVKLAKAYFKSLIRNATSNIW